MVSHKQTNCTKTVQSKWWNFATKNQCESTMNMYYFVERKRDVLGDAISLLFYTFWHCSLTVYKITCICVCVRCEHADLLGMQRVAYSHFDNSICIAVQSYVFAFIFVYLYVIFAYINRISMTNFVLKRIEWVGNVWRMGTIGKCVRVCVRVCVFIDFMCLISLLLLWCSTHFGWTKWAHCCWMQKSQTTKRNSFAILC